MHEVIIHETLLKKATHHNRNTKQHNTTCLRLQLFFKEKTVLGGIRTHDRALARRHSYQLTMTVHALLVYIVFTVLVCVQGAAVTSSEGNDEFHRLRQSLIMLGFSEQIQMW